MCNRYTLQDPDGAIAEIARILQIPLSRPEWIKRRYNVTPRTVVPAILNRGKGPELLPIAWGFPGGEPGSAHLNARSETALELRTFKGAARDHRCVVPANGFYDFFEDEDGRKWPHLFEMDDNRAFGIAALWNAGNIERGIPPGMALLTADPNAVVARIHDRMPIILRAQHYEPWLSQTELPMEEFKAMMQPYPSEKMKSREVNDFVNSVRNEGPECHAPPKPRGTQMGFGF